MKTNMVNDSSVLVLVVSVVVLTIALGLVTCVLNHYRATAANPQEVGQTPTTTPMLSVVSAGAAAGVGGMDRLRSRGTRELAAARDRQVRMHSVRTDLAINLPPRISMPDGEEHPYHSRLHIRDPEQESEIYQKCIKPPPNRTVLESESPPPYRSSSVGLLGSISGSSSSSGDWSSSSSSSTGVGSGCGGGLNNAPLVVRCHSMSSSSTGSSSKRGVETSSSATSSANHQKTDFLQRTVKRFTGGKKTNTTSTVSGGVAVAHQQQHVNVPVVIVPMRRNDHNFTSSNSTISPSSSLITTTTTAATTTSTINFSSNRPKPSV
ncbi:protein TMEPAI-like isoform X2 [Onthophagus taurus]|uniref:protein TMEPAI-like isoform X2 n=1 Tax=Onthophagus taurus TaxID=166361 RepID=UPI0039BE62A5